VLRPLFKKSNQRAIQVTPRKLTRTVTTAFLLLLGCAYAPWAEAQKTRQLPPSVRIHSDFKSQFLPKYRQIFVYLPPGYPANEAKRYPVLYLFDGANVFVTWEIDETARVLVEASHIEPLIIVGVAHGGTQEDRTNEYTPTSVNGRGGKGDDMGRMLVEELKPFIDREYRTLTEAAHTGLGGTSLGGLIALHIGLRYPKTFGKLAVMSPSVWWDRGVILSSVKSLTAKPAQRIWLDVGTEEGRGMADNAKRLRDALTEKGWALGSDLYYFEDKQARHEDIAWALRAPKVLRFLFPPSKVGG
jgi:predicted alpha/beta superfamily hydrolase